MSDKEGKSMLLNDSDTSSPKVSRNRWKNEKNIFFMNLIMYIFINNINCRFIKSKLVYFFVK